jgi:hypothetical protein
MRNERRFQAKINGDQKTATLPIVATFWTIAQFGTVSADLYRQGPYPLLPSTVSLETDLYVVGVVRALDLARKA